MAIEPRRLMRLATIASMAVAVVLIVAKMAAWWITDSVSMLSSLVDTSLDFVGSLVTFFAVRQALIPADADHRFGHGKAEALAGLVQAGFIAASGGALLLAVVERLMQSPPGAARKWSACWSARWPIVLTLGLVTFQRYVVQRSGSIAIGADMAHYKTDLVATIVTGVGLYRLRQARSAADRQRRGGTGGALPHARRVECRTRLARRADGPRTAGRGPPADPRHRAPPSRGARRARPAHAIGGPHQVHPAPYRRSTRRCRSGDAHVIGDTVEADARARPSRRPRSSCTSTAGTIASSAAPSR